MARSLPEAVPTRAVPVVTAAVAPRLGPSTTTSSRDHTRSVGFTESRDVASSGYGSDMSGAARVGVGGRLTARWLRGRRMRGLAGRRRNGGREGTGRGWEDRGG